ncbi:hypothetical protein U5N28_17860 [Lysinibacillus telephonicus]|uniref:hypothetical protein n=1 Tax=Lysinibacillus telephonicus TaxID=1714840 RepID=UPI00397BD0BA
MGIYINHPGVYMNDNELVEPNQMEFKRDYLSDMLEQHRASIQTVHQKVSRIQNSQLQWNQQQLMKWGSFDLRFSELKNQVKNSIVKVEAQNLKFEQILNHEQQINDSLSNQVNSISNSQKEIVKNHALMEDKQREVIELLKELAVINEAMMKRIEQVAFMNEQMKEKLDEQYQLNDQMVSQVSYIEESQKDVLNRVDCNEGLMEKIIRQIDHLRTILFERSNFIEEKIEKVYQNSSDYIEKLKNGI